ncbi:MAG: hypothetical protein AAGH64_11590 [Planctomycetota bacterium]
MPFIITTNPADDPALEELTGLDTGDAGPDAAPSRHAPAAFSDEAEDDDDIIWDEDDDDDDDFLEGDRNWEFGVFCSARASVI